MADNKEPVKEGVVEEYDLEADQISLKVRIIAKRGALHIYELIIPETSPATKALMNDIKNQLVTEVNVSASEILDPKAIINLKEKFRKKAESVILEKVPNVNRITKAFLIGTLLHDMVGLGKLEFLLNDGLLEEIIINSSKEPIRVYHKKYGWLESNIYVQDEEQIMNYANIIARRVGRQITTLNPLLDAHLVTGDRANAVLYPISTRGNTITIRKFARDPWTAVDFIANKTANSQVFSLIWLAIQYEMNILISGGTASGKTSFLNVCMSFIPPNHRIISMEDTRELQLPKFLYWCPLTTRQPNPEGKGEISMLDLLVNSLRMRPDRIILGEIRRKREAEVLFEAMHTGHSVYATVHADSINETIQRLISPPIEIAPNLLGSVNLNIVMFRDRRKGLRRPLQIGEFMLTEEGGKTSVKPNIIFRWKPSTDTIIKHSQSIKLYEELCRHTGLSQLEINKDLNTKKNILEFLVKHKIRDIESVGKVIKEYYVNPDFVIDIVEKNKNPELLIK